MKLLKYIAFPLMVRIFFFLGALLVFPLLPIGRARAWRRGCVRWAWKEHPLSLGAWDVWAWRGRGTGRGPSTLSRGGL